MVLCVIKLVIDCFSSVANATGDLVMMGVWHCALDTIEGEPIPVRDTIGDICTVVFLYYRRHTILPAMIVFSGL